MATVLLGNFLQKNWKNWLNIRCSIIEAGSSGSLKAMRRICIHIFTKWVLLRKQNYCFQSCIVKFDNKIHLLLLKMPKTKNVQKKVEIFRQFIEDDKYFFPMDNYNELAKRIQTLINDDNGWYRQQKEIDVSNFDWTKIIKQYGELLLKASKK